MHIDDIYSLSDFKRRTSAHLKRLAQTGRPTVLTVNGRAKIVVQDASSYQRLLDAIERAKVNFALSEALDQVERSESVRSDEALALIRERLGLSQSASGA